MLEPYVQLGYEQLNSHSVLFMFSNLPITVPYVIWVAESVVKQL
jgi:hypothetical protein